MKTVVAASFAEDARNFIRKEGLDSSEVLIVTPITVSKLEGRRVAGMKGYDIRRRHRDTIPSDRALDHAIDKAWVFDGVKFEVKPW